MGNNASIGRLAGEAARAVRNHAFEKTNHGIFLPKAKVHIGGVLRHTHIDAAGNEDVAVDPNLIVNEGLNYILNAALGGQSQVGAFFLAPFSGNVTPAAGWTGANFASNATEFTAYTNSTRLPWTTVPATAQSIGNSAALAAATATFSAGGPYNLYGVGLLQASAKSATTGVLVAAVRFASPRLNMAAGDKLAFEYVLAASDDGV